MSERVTIEVDPPNLETPIEALADPVTATDRFYVRSHFPVPDLDAGTWALQVDGTVDSPRAFSLDDLRALPSTEVVATLECAGNGRRLMRPTPDGTPWGLGAVSVARFRGARLRDLLAQVDPRSDTAEFVFTGADHGDVEGQDRPYAFSLPADEAQTDGPLLAWEMNGAALPPLHGYPVRLVVPGDYGMRSVKWLTSITAADVPFDGHFVRSYRYVEDPVAPPGAPVSRVRVRSLITSPLDRVSLPTGPLDVHGIAWSGGGPITEVAISVNGESWDLADLGEPDGPHAPTPWHLSVSLDRGNHQLAARATDAGGDRQPLDAIWNRHGYGNNVVHRIRVTVG